MRPHRLVIEGFGPFRDRQTVDFDTVDNGTVTVRERDTMAQVRIPVGELDAYLTNALDY